MADRKAIFIVEDEPMIGMMLEDFLETLGYAPVAIAETLVLAEEKAKSVPFDGAILDCNIGTEKVWRSEEHTSELQSLMRSSYAVFCLKKKTKHTTKQTQMK